MIFGQFLTRCKKIVFVEMLLMSMSYNIESSIAKYRQKKLNFYRINEDNAA